MIVRISHAISAKHNNFQSDLNRARRKREYAKARARVIQGLEAEGWTLTPPGLKIA